MAVSSDSYLKLDDNFIHSFHSDSPDLQMKSLHLSTHDQEIKVEDLVVGYNDLSLTSSSATSSNIVPESPDIVRKDHSEPRGNVEERGANVVQEIVDVHNMINQNLCVKECVSYEHSQSDDHKKLRMILSKALTLIDQPVLAKIETRCIGHYNNQQKILLVGEGDFSFASSLATAFFSATNLTATSLDSKDTVISRYWKAKSNLQDLESRGAIVIHEVDAHTMNNHPNLQYQLFDRIVFNFPHAGDIYGSCTESDAWYIQCHQHVVKGFFKTARKMLRKDGEIHVTHKTTHPFDTWDIVGLAQLADLELTRKVRFNKWVYPGYENKKAYMHFSGRKGRKVKESSWDSTFPVGECSTFMFSKT